MYQRLELCIVVVVYQPPPAAWSWSDCLTVCFAAMRSHHCESGYGFFYSSAVSFFPVRANSGLFISYKYLMKSTKIEQIMTETITNRPT